MQKKGNKYGVHRVIEPKGLMTQAAKKIDNTMECYSNEILCDVSALNIDSASFTQIYEACGKDLGKTEQMILDIVNERGKMQNPVTGSGGMFIGTVKEIGEDLQGKIDLKVGDKIASLVSLSLTPLKINKIKAIHPEIDRVDVEAQAILFESGLYAKLPDDMSEELALAALDVAGAPAQTAKLVKPGDSVLILGGAGKGGMMCCYEAMKRVGPTGNVVALVICQEDADLLKSMNLCHHAIVGSATNPTEVLGDENGWVKGMTCVEMELGEPDASGRRRPIVKEGSEFVLDVDTMIMALGTSPNPLIRSTTPGLDADKHGCLITNGPDGLTSRPMVYAGGDAVTGAATVILAMGAGKEAARAIDAAIMGKEK